MSMNWTTITDPSQLLAVPNTQTGGWFWTFMLITLFIIIFITLIRYQWQVSALTAAFISLIASFFLYYAGLVSFSYSILIFLPMILILVLIIYWSSPSENI